MPLFVKLIEDGEHDGSGRIIAMEQFRNPRIAQLISKHHMDGL